jgi:hypothetical protein
MPKASSGIEPVERKAFRPKGSRIPAIMPLATPFGTCAIRRSKLPDRPMTSRMPAAVR